MANKDSMEALFQGLNALSECAFPKACFSCGKVYQTSTEFLADTESIRGLSGLKSSIDDDGGTLVELYRNCSCGSTLMDFFSERRDSSERGAERRKKFSKMVSLLEERGITSEDASRELKNLMRGKDSALLRNLGFRTSQPGKN